MKSRTVPGGYLLRLEKGEEALASLALFAGEHGIQCGFLQGIGAVNDLELGYFDTEAGDYRRRLIQETVEVVSLTGNVSLLDGKPFIHAHVAVAGPDQKLLGGHFFRGVVAVTLEIFIHVVPEQLTRKPDPDAGFNFWDL